VQALEDVVPRRVRDLDAAHRHRGHGPDAPHGVRLLQDGVELATQAKGAEGGAGGRSGSRSALSSRWTRRSWAEKAARTRSWGWWRRRRAAACASPTPRPTIRRPLKRFADGQVMADARHHRWAGQLRRRQPGRAALRVGRAGVISAKPAPASEPGAGTQRIARRGRSPLVVSQFEFLRS
jgi:hypothetical protein